MTNCVVFAVLFCAFVSHALGMGCIDGVCKRVEKADQEEKADTTNTYRTCYLPDNKGPNLQCGRYMSTRWSGQILKAVDLYCEKGDEVLAPFDAVVHFHAPYGDGTRWDTGLRFTGLGQWKGYEVTISHVTPKLTSGQVKKGQVVGHALATLEDAQGMHKLKLSKEVSNNFIQLAMKRHGRVVDPTGHLFKCSCTGQICETNPTNSLIGDYKTTTDYTGFELQCPNKIPLKEAGIVPEPLIPAIYSPIDGARLGRIRTRGPASDGSGYPCSAEGIYIEGSGSVWNDYEVRIYNVKFTERPGARDIKVGDRVAVRLDCEGVNTIAVELRFKGRQVNFKPQLTAHNCTMPRDVQKR